MTMRGMQRGVLLGLVVLSLASPASAYLECDPTVNDCPNADVTSSHIQIGGEGSLSSNDTCGANPSCNDPGRLDNGTIAEALLSFELERSTSTLTIVLDNTTDTTASLTAIYFNVPSGVTGMSVVGGSLSKTCPPLDTICPVLSSWQVVFNPANIQADGFGRFDAYVGNGGDTGNGGGNPIEILAGEVLTLELALTGDVSAATACSFTSEGSKIPPGEKVVTGIGRFQAGGMNGDSGWIGPCVGDGELFVDLKFFHAEPADGRVVLNWETATELDNLGFNVLRKPELGGPWEVINSGLIAPKGDPLAGADYSFVDPNVVNGVRYVYRLEDIDLSGFNTLHRPDQTVPNPPNPPIKLQEPAYGRSFRDAEAITLRWESDLRGPMRVQFSADPTFPDSNRVEFPARGRKGTQVEMELGAHERMLVSAVMGLAEGGQIYWRVVELPRGGREAAGSDVFRFGRGE